MCSLLIFANLPHKFYISVMDVELDDKEQLFKITLKTFADDTQVVLEKHFGKESIKIPTEGVLSSDVSRFMKSYFKEKMALRFDSKKASHIEYIGSEADWDNIYHYFQVPAPDTIASLTLKNAIFMEYFPTQKNIAHFNISGERYTLVISGDRKEKTIRISDKNER